MGLDIKHYMNLPYKIEIVPIPESLGGGYSAQLPQLGKHAIVGDGDTVEEALANLDTIKLERFTEYLKKGIDIPDPAFEGDDFSGKFIVRMPKALHKELINSAKANAVSLNQYVNFLLANNFNIDKSEKLFTNIHHKLDHMNDFIRDRYSSQSFYKTKKINPINKKSLPIEIVKCGGYKQVA